ncbi:DNA polymerase [Ralstonia phage RSL2]|nr:DNA polymerase [Ralstonia phage RSL2]
MKDPSDEERERVVDSYRRYFEKEYEAGGALTKRVHELTDLVRSGKRIGLRCWCHPKRCHGNIIISKIKELLEGNMTESPQQPSKEFLNYPFAKEDIDYVECRFAIHIPKDKHNDKSIDLHAVKEIIHFKDGTTKPWVKYIPNYQCKFWTTKPHVRNGRFAHKQKKEWESLDNLIEGQATASGMGFAVARALDQMRLADRIFDLKDSPFVYGLDIPSTVQLKHDYTVRMQGKADTPFTIAYSDTETNMLGIEEGASKHIIMQSLFHEDGRLFTVILEDFVKTLPNPQKDLRALYDEHMPQQGKDLVKDWEIAIVKEPIDIVKAILQRCHTWQPDFLSFWNMIFDLDKMIQCVEDAGYRPEDIFCDPRLPRELRYAFLKRANPSKTSASGRLMTKKPADQWHSWLCPASFYIIDQMATYRFVRKSKQLEKSYGLDDILGKELEGLGKLKHKPAEGLTKAEFHIFMQQKYPGEYVIYHIWDAVCMHLLTLKTKDLSFSLPGTTEFSDFVSFESEPKRYIHKFHFYALENHRCVTGVSSKALVQEYDDMTISTKGHIVTLEPHLTVDSGMKIFNDYPELQTNFYGHNADLDVKSSYPYGQWVFNMSRQTTVRELVEIEGVRDHTRRIQGLNISGGRSNAVEFCTEIFGLPTLAELDKIYDQAHA